MKKLLPKLALALVPVLAYVCIFVAFDAYNYFGLQATTNTNNPVMRVKGFTQNPTDYIILGDSRLAHFDSEIIREVNGHAYTNLAFGGASLEESLDLFDYAYKTNPNLKGVVFGLSFYTLNKSYGSVSRMSTIKTQLQNPVAYISNLEYNVNMLTNLQNKLTGAPDDTEAEETRTPLPDDYTAADGTQLPYRKDLILYATNLYTNCAVPGTLPKVQTAADGSAANVPQLLAAMQSTTATASKWALNEKQLQRLLDTVALCKQKGIAFAVVLPPMDESVRTLVCDALGITPVMQRTVQQLQAAGVTVYDYEWQPLLALTDASFYDGFHLDTRSGLALFTRSLFEAVN